MNRPSSLLTTIRLYYPDLTKNGSSIVQSREKISRPANPS